MIDSVESGALSGFSAVFLVSHYLSFAGTDAGAVVNCLHILARSLDAR